MATVLLIRRTLNGIDNPKTCPAPILHEPSTLGFVDPSSCRGRAGLGYSSLGGTKSAIHSCDDGWSSRVEVHINRLPSGVQGKDVRASDVTWKTRRKPGKK
jgi:hypothetical protein